MIETSSVITCNIIYYFFFNFNKITTLISPLLSSIIILCFGRFFGRFGSPLIGIFSIFLSWFTCFLWLCYGFNYSSFGLWFSIGSLNSFWSFNFGALSWLMCFTVTTVSLVVHFFSFFYMSQDPHIIRFFAYLNLFTFFMLFLITSDNLLLIFWGWEGVGICSYLLINFWYNRIMANKSALKAVFINKISDIFLLYGIVLISIELNTLELPVFFSLIPFIKLKGIYIFGSHFNLLNVIAFFLMLGAFGKSAQVGLHIWLPEAMEGPTPVSALIHAATMVTAGVFLIIRFSILFEYCPNISKIILFIGSLTALLSSLIGSFQYDIKKIIAYSTCSQLGYMFVGCGLSHYTLTLFHLFNHAFFKALLFLSSGLIIHSLNTQDIRNFAKTKEVNVIIIIYFLIPSLSLCGLPFFSGAFSKELIISLSSNVYLIDGEFIYFMLILAACMTLYYSIKLTYFIYAKTKIHRIYNIGKDGLKNIITKKTFYKSKSGQKLIIKRIFTWSGPLSFFFFISKNFSIISLHVVILYGYIKSSKFYSHEYSSISDLILLISLSSAFLIVINVLSWLWIYFLNKLFIIERWPDSYAIIIKKKGEFTEAYVYFPFTILVFLSLFSGFLFQDIFLGLGSDFFIKDIFINSVQKHRFLESNFEFFLFFKKYLPFLLTILSFLFFEYLNFLMKSYLKIYYFFKLKLYFDFVYNFMILNLKKINFLLFFKLLDKGILEILGPNGIIRHSWWMVQYIKFFNISLLYNYICLFLFFFSYSLFF